MLLGALRDVLLTNEVYVSCGGDCGAAGGVGKDVKHRSYRDASRDSTITRNRTGGRVDRYDRRRRQRREACGLLNESAQGTSVLRSVSPLLLDLACPRWRRAAQISPGPSRTAPPHMLFVALCSLIFTQAYSQLRDDRSGYTFNGLRGRISRATKPCLLATRMECHVIILSQSHCVKKFISSRRIRFL